MVERPLLVAKGEEAWPNKFYPEDSTEVKEERRKVNVLLNVSREIKQVRDVIDSNRFSSLHKLLRVTAYVKQFIGNLRLHRKGEELISGELNADELRNVEITWIKDAQQDMKSRENFDKTRESLNVIQQNEILIRKGRLENSEVNEDTKYPIILPKNNRFTDLVILDCHSRVHHLKVRSTLGELSQNFG